jgi:4-amino-4-deoxy-L-arabinose transferase-like glycosyltransferase
LAACCAAGLFALLGAAIIPYPGIYPDEVIFTNPLYLFSPREFTVNLFHHDETLMLLSYLGTLKTLVFIPILAIFHANVWSLRLPTVLLGALTILIFFSLARRAAGTTIACAAAFLLATDPMYVLTNTVDWGPVALEHFLLVTGCFFLLRFAQEPGSGRLFLGFFLFGLALWNKATFIWALAGLFSAAAVVF